MQAPLTLQPVLSELPRLIACIESFAEANELPPAHAIAFSLAAEELFANTIHHSQPPATLVELNLALIGDKVVATYTDDAPPFDPTRQATPDTTLPATERTVGGLGLHLIRKSMSVFTYARERDRNVITLGRDLAPDKKVFPPR